jgi:hypothetical protein
MSMWKTDGWRQCDQECNEIGGVKFLQFDRDTGVGI